MNCSPVAVCEQTRTWPKLPLPNTLRTRCWDCKVETGSRRWSSGRSSSARSRFLNMASRSLSDCNSLGSFPWKRLQRSCNLFKAMSWPSSSEMSPLKRKSEGSLSSEGTALHSRFAAEFQNLFDPVPRCWCKCRDRSFRSLPASDGRTPQNRFSSRKSLSAPVAHPVQMAKDQRTDSSAARPIPAGAANHLKSNFHR